MRLYWFQVRPRWHQRDLERLFRMLLIEPQYLRYSLVDMPLGLSLFSH